MDEIFVWRFAVAAAGLGLGMDEVVSDEVEDLDWDPGLAVSEMDFRLWDDANPGVFGWGAGRGVEGHCAIGEHACWSLEWWQDPMLNTRRREEGWS